MSGSTVYVGSRDYNVYALGAATGHLRWSYTAGNAVTAALALSGRIVYVGSDDNKVYAPCSRLDGRGRRGPGRGSPAAAPRGGSCALQIGRRKTAGVVSRLASVAAHRGWPRRGRQTVTSSGLSHD